MQIYIGTIIKASLDYHYTLNKIRFEMRNVNE